MYRRSTLKWLNRQPCRWPCSGRLPAFTRTFRVYKLHSQSTKLHTFRARWPYSRAYDHFALISLALGAICVYNSSYEELRKQLFAITHPRSDATRGFADRAGPSPHIHVTNGNQPGRNVQIAAESGKQPRQTSGQQAPPPQTRIVQDGEVTDDDDARAKDSNWNSLTTTLSGIQWSSLSERIREFVVPDWVMLLPGLITKLQGELSMSPGSLAEEIWMDANDPEVNPEIMWDCAVRVSEDLCEEEKSFLRRRKPQVVRALARYLEIAEDTIHPDDVPVISMCGSGGGLRALVAGSASYLCTREAGLFDCATYTAGVSGSCWLQMLFYSSIARQDHKKLIQHLKNRLGVHIAYPPAALTLTTYAPTNKFLLTGLVEKLKGTPAANFGIVDIYGLLLAGRLLVPKGELGVDFEDLKLSNQRRFVDYGQQPLPIYTAVRHEIPLEESSSGLVSEEHTGTSQGTWFQWFEFTPYEFWCEEFGAGIPTWAIGREFKDGRSMAKSNGLAQPEIRVPQFMGIWGSAFCATLSHYYREIRPIMLGVAGFAGVDQLVAQRDDDLAKIHVFEPATIPNFVTGMESQLPITCSKSVVKAQHLQLMDAGMSNNLPIYPLLRPGRNVDVIIAFDSSADVKQDNWLHVCDGYARQRGIKGWPIGAGWPPPNESPAAVITDLEHAQAETPEEAVEKVERAQQENDVTRSDSGAVSQNSVDLGYCNVWVGTMEERTAEATTPRSQLVEEDWQLMKADAGITVVYLPFLPNQEVADVDPKTSDYLSTWNFVYTPDQVDQVVALARANFEAGKDQIKRTIKAVYERKKMLRLEKEKSIKQNRRRWKMRRGLGDRRLGEGDHADQFR